MSDIRKGDELWIQVNSGCDFNPQDRKQSDCIWTKRDIEEHVIPNKGHPKRWIKVRVIESKGYWKGDD